MFKRYASIIAIIMFLFTLVPICFEQKAFAYQNNGYFNNLKIGLVSMSATSITTILNGDYSVNGKVYPSGTVFNLEISGTSITLNGVVQSQITFTPNNSTNLLTLSSGSVFNKYMGSFLFKLYNGKILPINSLDIENYLKGVVGNEMSDSYPSEALKVQAVSARNYAISRIGYEAANGYDFDDTSSYQTYKGFDLSLKNVINAVDQTRGQVLLYNDKLVEALYSAWHGGVSEDSENVWGNTVPYLRSVQDSFENLTWPNGNIILTNAQVQNTLVAKRYLASTDNFIKLDLNSITRFASGRVSNINIIYKDKIGVTQIKSVTKDSTRTFLGLPSNLYTVTYDKGSGAYTFSGKGNGHGLGMSQIGAKNRAAAGQTYDQILKFYYQNVYLQNLILKAAISSITQSTNTLLVGNTISFNITGAAGNGYGYLYKYVIMNGSNPVFTRDYCTTSTLDFAPSSPGSYTIQAYIKDKYSVSEYDDTKSAAFTVYRNPVINSFTANKASYLAGQTLKLNTTAAFGSGSYLYKYVISLDGVILNTADYSNSTNLLYTANNAGTYTVTAYVKDALSVKEYDDMQVLTIPVYKQPTMTLTATQTSVLTGNAVNFTMNEVNGSGSAKNRFVVMNGSSTVIDSGYLASKDFSFTPTAAGTYQVVGYSKDDLSENVYDAQSSINLTVYNPQITTVGVSGYLYDGKTITLNANSIGASPAGMNYKYEVYYNGTLVTSNTYSSFGTYKFTPTSGGTYTVKVYGKDGLSTNAYDSMKQFDITINSKPLYIATLPLSYGMNSNDVASLQNALMKLGYGISSATGYFGSQTKNAVISFQTNAGIPATGTVGSWTCNSLNDALITKAGLKNLTF